MVDAYWPNRTRRIINRFMWQPMSLISRWLVVIPKECKGEATDSLEFIRRACESLNMTMEYPDIEYIDDDTPNIDLLERFNCRKNYELIVCFYTSDTDDGYFLVKNFCDDHSVPCYIITLEDIIHYEKRSRFAIEIALKIKCKFVDSPCLVPKLSSGVMIVGYHASLGCGAMVATLNDVCNAYNCSVSEYIPVGMEQLSNCLSQQLLGALCAYKQSNNCLPNQIVLYRNEPSNAQIQHEFSTEIESVKTLLSQLYRNPTDYKFTFIVKHVPTSSRSKASSNQISNSPVGTGFETDITLLQTCQFALVPQYTILSGTHLSLYTVIYDTSGFSQEVLTLMTYAFSQMYYSWTRIVLVPAPLRCADNLWEYYIRNHFKPKSRMLSID